MIAEEDRVWKPVTAVDGSLPAIWLAA